MRGDWFDGTWHNGTWLCGQWLGGKWLGGYIGDGMLTPRRWRKGRRPEKAK